MEYIIKSTKYLFFSNIKNRFFFTLFISRFPDPYYEGSEGFELVLDLLEDACDNLLNRIIEQNNI